MANNPFIGGVNPQDTIFGGISQAGALGGQSGARRTEPLISVRGGEVSRLTFANGQAIDPFNVWTQSANPPLRGGLITGAGIRESIIPAGQQPPGYLKIPGGGPFHFAGDFSAAFVFRFGAATGVLYQDGTYNINGYFIQESGGNTISFYQNGAGVAAFRWDTFAGSVVGVLCCVCVGVAGATTMLKINLRPLVSGAGAAYVPAGGDFAIGATSGGSSSFFDNDIYEAWFSTQTPSDALFTAIQTEVKTKLGITAW